jgi:hypothetical protein
MNITLTAIMLASHIRTKKSIDNEIAQAISSKPSGEMDSRGKIQVEFLKLLFNIEKINTNPYPRHTQAEMRKVLDAFPKLGNDQITQAICWMKEENRKARESLDFCDCCNREGVDRMNPPKVFNIFLGDMRIQRRRRQKYFA